MLFNKRLLQNAIQTAESNGVQTALEQLFSELGVRNITRTGEKLPNGPLLIISNHPGVFDSLVLLSHIEREDFHFVALSTYGVFGEKIREKLLPIFRKKQLNHKIYEYPLSLQMTGFIQDELSDVQIKSKNRATISQAAQLINKGKAVSIFPTGSAGKRVKESTWKAGVGFLVKQISHPDTQVVFVNIKGTRKSDLVAYLHPLIRKTFFKPQPITIHFSVPQKLSALVDLAGDGKSIAKKLEVIYNQTVH